MAPLSNELAEANAAILSDYERHFVSERTFRRSVRAYLGDVADLLEHLQRLGSGGLADADLGPSAARSASSSPRQFPPTLARVNCAQVFATSAFGDGNSPT